MDTATNTTESKRGEVGQGLYSLADLRAYLALTGKAEDQQQDLGPDKAGYWLANVLNAVDRRPRQPDHSFSDLISLFVVRELRRRGVTPAKIRESETYLRNLWQTDRPS